MKTNSLQLTAWTSLKYAVLVMFAVTFLGSEAYASNFSFVLCKAYVLMQGHVVKGVGTIAIMALGAGALFGKVSWTMATLVGVGVGALFGASSIMGGVMGGWYNCG